MCTRLLTPVPLLQARGWIRGEPACRPGSAGWGSVALAETQTCILTCKNVFRYSSLLFTFFLHQTEQDGASEAPLAVGSAPGIGHAT
jgi:hypothetical protein